ncbi:alpha/beta fold hydrolase [Lipingzhangella sp. LS1_29]|uniref:Alpha/beta fold hydrolase n=1 Tax=Lipingzhangella rawalii TaxID=2055835 RepID=A0ABU2H4S5_9ACTN|nr:alpha/beta fold hydrolase [Lipingzhangella rawalii]MDS1269614.1 alpha/beta fold hydrolase [Lipingzhangella rawalii]
MGASVVFCLPHAGGGQHQYLSWSRAMADVLTWVPIEYPGRFTRDDEPPWETFPEAVTDVVSYVEDRGRGHRVGLFGHSLGGALAFEAARRLSERGQVPLDSVMVSGCEPPSAAGTIHQRYFELDDEQLLAHLQHLGGPAAREPLASRMLTETLPLIRSDYRLHHSYTPDPDCRIGVPLTVCIGRDDPLHTDRIQAWHSHSSVSVRFHRFDGGHFYWQADAGPLTKLIREVFAPDSKTATRDETKGSACRD